jgi:hypothetical protein
MPYCPNTKCSSLEWNQWPPLDLSIHCTVIDPSDGNTGGPISKLKAGLVDPNSLQGARAVSRTLLQCLKQVEKIDDGNSTQELQASVLAHRSCSAVMSGVPPCI